MDNISGTIEQKYLIMLQERIDCLTDEVNELRQHILKSCPPFEFDYNNISIYLDDINVLTRQCFLRVNMKNKQSTDQLLKYLRNHEDIKEILPFIKATKCMFFRVNGNTWREDLDQFLPGYEICCDDEHQHICICKDNFSYPETYIFQALIRFNKTIYISNLANDIYNVFNDYLEKDLKEINENEKSIVIMPITNPDIFTYYEYYIVAGIRDKNVKCINIDDITWYTKNSSYYRGSIYGSMLQTYDEFFDEIWINYENNFANDEYIIYVLLPPSLYDRYHHSD